MLRQNHFYLTEIATNGFQLRLPPIGTEIKAVTPEEIAISIVGEMIYERAALRESCGIKAHGCPMH